MNYSDCIEMNNKQYCSVDFYNENYIIVLDKEQILFSCIIILSFIVLILIFLILRLKKKKMS